MAGSEGSSRRKGRPFLLDAEAVGLLITVQDRLTPKPNQPDTIKWALQLLEKNTRHLQPKSHDDLRDEILGQAS
jgi:hypothetical protein